MKLVWAIVLGVAALLAAFLAGSFFLPSQMTVHRSIVIAAEPPQIFPYLNSMKAFYRWSPWTRKDPKAVYEFSGPESGPGSKMSWKSEDPDVGTGSMEIVKVSDGEQVNTELKFDNQPPTHPFFLVTPVDGGSEVTWGVEIEFTGVPLARYAGLVMDHQLGAEFESGLARLKQLVESGTPSP